MQLENAANACALAELWSGRQDESVRNLVAVTVSEGIGVGLILNGQLITGTSGLAGEFGHVTLDENGPLCQCGNRGCWEVCGSNTAAVRYYTQSNAATHSARASSGPTFDDVINLAAQGDKKAAAALNRMAYFLGAGLAMVVGGLSPDVIVVIGEVTGAWDSVGPRIDQVLKERLGSRAVTRVIPSNPDMELRLRGTITLVLQQHFGAPHMG